MRREKAKRVSDYRGRSALVLGGLGYIGRHVTERLHAEGGVIIARHIFPLMDHLRLAIDDDVHLRRAAKCKQGG